MRPRTIDAISREKRSLILFFTFFDTKINSDATFELEFSPEKIKDLNLFSYVVYDPITDPYRQKIIQWLRDENIPYEECHTFSSFDLMDSVPTDIYLDVKPDVSDPNYRKVCNFVETENGFVKSEFGPYTRFWVLSPSYALKFAYRDEPGYYDDDK